MKNDVSDKNTKPQTGAALRIYHALNGTGSLGDLWSHGNRSLRCEVVTHIALNGPRRLLGFVAANLKTTVQFDRPAPTLRVGDLSSAVPSFVPTPGHTW